MKPQLIYPIILLSILLGACQRPSDKQLRSDYQKLKSGLLNPSLTTRLDLSGEELSEVPKEIFKFHHLSFLDLRNNFIRAIPLQLLRKLGPDTLLIGDNYLSEEAWLTLKKQFPDVVIDEYSPQSVTCENFEQCKNNHQDWWNLHIAEPCPNDSLITLASALTHVKNLSLICDSLPDAPLICLRFPELWMVSLNELKIENVPNEFAQLKYLRICSFNNNKMTEFQECFTKMNLHTLTLMENQIETIPESISEISLLTELYLSQNNIKQLPASISKLKHLKVLWLQDNPISETEKAKIRKWLPHTDIYF